MKRSLIRGISIYIVLLLVAPPLAPLTQALYGYYTHDWTPLVSYGAAVTGSFIVSAGAISVTTGMTFGEAEAVAREQSVLVV